MENGIIPAYAGSTGGLGSGQRGTADHPRIRGEHCQAILPVSFLAGSSPHTRGARRRLSGARLRRRIIPAYAGSTRIRWPRRARGRDHPRIRGEHCESYGRERTGAGSSPHTRGARHLLAPSPVGQRIIPAYAGSTGAGWLIASWWADHPRIRGEHGLHQERPRWPGGSSPHTRGAPGRW